MDKTNIKLTLMNKNTPVLDLNFCMRRGGYISDIIKLTNPEYAPLGLVNNDKEIDTDSLSDWWDNRCLPDSRLNAERFFEAMQLKKQELIINSLGLSLSDQYWLKPIGSNLEWKDINFFHNNFSDKVGKLFFNRNTTFSKQAQEILQSYSPDYSSNGFLDKYWTIDAGNRILVKGCHGPFAQQAYNEVIASKILKLIGCHNYVNYELKDGLSICKNFITDNTEYVPAALIRRRLPQEDNETFFNHFMRCCKALGFEKEMQKALDYILPFDYLIANEDRNFGNFGVIRNVETLKIVRIAPIFDNGNSLWYNQINISNDNLKAYPFELTQESQIKLVKDKSIFPVKKLHNVNCIIKNILQHNKSCDKSRIEKICKGVEQRVHKLTHILVSGLVR